MGNVSPIVHQTGDRANGSLLSFGRFAFACLCKREKLSSLSGRCQRIGDQKSCEQPANNLRTSETCKTKQVTEAVDQLVSRSFRSLLEFVADSDSCYTPPWLFP